MGDNNQFPSLLSELGTHNSSRDIIISSTGKKSQATHPLSEYCYLANLEAVIRREGEKPAGTVQVGDRGATDSLKDASGKALHIEHVHVLQPHQGPCCSLKVFKGWQVLLYPLVTILQSCKGRENNPPFTTQAVSI